MLLRGINVGGRSLSMASLRSGLSAAGCSDVVTYIQSGNVVLRMPESLTVARDAWLASVIGEVAGFDVAVVTRTADELDAVVAGNPYPHSDGARLHVVFFADPLPPSVLGSVAIEEFAPEECSLVGRDLYLHLPNGMGRALLPVALEKSGKKAKSKLGTAQELEHGPEVAVDGPQLKRRTVGASGDVEIEVESDGVDDKFTGVPTTRRGGGAREWWSTGVWESEGWELDDADGRWSLLADSSARPFGESRA